METEGNEHAFYSNAPIIQALIDVRFEPDGTRNFDGLMAVSEQLSRPFPIRTPRRNLHIDPATGTQEQQVKGLDVSSLDGIKSVRLEEDLFAYFQMGKYPGWKEFFGNASKQMAVFARYYPHARIVRLGVRFVNRIDLLAPVKTEEFFQIRPEMPKALEDMYRFALQVEVPIGIENGAAVINQGAYPSHIPQNVAIVLDIDTFVNFQRERAVELKDSDKVASLLHQVRAEKNRIFENCITDKMRNLIK